MSKHSFNGAAARTRRIVLGLKVADVAERVNRSPKSIYAYERRNVLPPPPVRLAIEDLYGLEPGALLVTTAREEDTIDA